MNESDLVSDEKLDNITITPVSVIPDLWIGRLTDYFRSLSEKDLTYKPDSKSFLRQLDINASMRSILLDWLMEVCSVFTFKRETYYICLSTLDRYLSLININKSELQLIGVTCLYIACKREEITSPSITDFAKTADDSFTVQEIRGMENKVLVGLKWQMCPVTFYNWLSAMLNEWDQFILHVFQDIIGHYAVLQEDVDRILITFKQNNRYSYDRYHECLELLDICTLDFNVYKHLPMRVVAAIVYLMVNRCFMLTKYELLPGREEINDDYECSVIVDGLLQQFFMATVEIYSIESLIPAIKFLESFRNFPFQTEPARYSLVSAHVINI